MFKNLIVYRIGPGWAANSAELEAGLEKMVFVECGATQPLSAGWAPPRVPMRRTGGAIGSI